MDFSFLIDLYNISWSSVLRFYNSGSFAVIKFLIGIYVIVLIVDLILLIILAGLGQFRETLYGMDLPQELVTKKHKLRKQWANVRNRLKSDKEEEYKLAIIEADGIIDDLLKKLGYAGENFTERLESIPPAHFENLDEFKKAHAIRNQIIHNEGFVVKKETAEEVIGIFEKFLNTFEVL